MARKMPDERGEWEKGSERLGGQDGLLNEFILGNSSQCV